MRTAWVIMAAGLLLAACGDKNKNDAGDDEDRTPIVLRQLSDACQKITHAPAAECDCRAGIYVGHLSPEDAEILADYFGNWAGHTAYPEAEKQARIATAQKNKLDPKTLDDLIGKATALDLAACKGKT